MSNQPWFVDKLDALVDEFYDQFEDEMGEQIFMFLTEQNGRKGRTIIEAAEAVTASIEGETLEDIVNEEAQHEYDYYFEKAQDLASQVMDGVVKRWAREF